MAKPLPRIDDTPQQQRQLQPVAKPAEHAPISEGYKASRIDVKLPPSHADRFHRKWMSLMDSGARLEDGTEVTDRTKAFLWILENEVKV